MNEVAHATAGNLRVADFHLGVHDGIVTVENPATGQHRTFKVRTVRSGDLKDKRIVSLLRGPNHGEGGDWIGFGFVQDDRVRIWKKCQGENGERSQFQIFANMLQNPAKFEEKGAVYHIEAVCRKCGRLLTEPESIRLGIGPVCRGDA